MWLILRLCERRYHRNSTREFVSLQYYVLWNEVLEFKIHWCFTLSCRITENTFLMCIFEPPLISKWPTIIFANPRLHPLLLLFELDFETHLILYSYLLQTYFNNELDRRYMLMTLLWTCSLKIKNVALLHLVGEGERERERTYPSLYVE